MPPAAAVDRFARDLIRLAPPPSRDAPLAVAVSGGADSMAMLALAAAAFPGSVVAATVDHLLRADAADEAAMVGAWCMARGIDHATLTPPAPPVGASIQARARGVRYPLLAGWAAGRGASALATAHHVDDQAETVLMRAARGSGPGGLAGIRPAWTFDPDRWTDGGSGGPAGAGAMRVVRPLLSWRRAELCAIAAAGPFVDDPSNADPRHDRTRFRALLGEGRLDPVALARVADHCREADAVLAETADTLWQDRARGGDAGWRIDVAGIPRELRRRLARRAIGMVRHATPTGEGDWSDAANVERLLDVLEQGGRATRAGVLAGARGTVWHFAGAPPRRSP